MSTTFDATDVPDDPAKVFAELVADPDDPTDVNPRVCQACYSRLRRLEAFPDAVGEEHGDVLAYVDATTENDIERAYRETVPLADRTDSEHPPDDPAASARTTVCGNCGTADFHTSPPRRSKADLLDALDQLATTLNEYGVELDESVLEAETAHLKSECGGELLDEEILADAVAAAIRRA